MRWNSLLVLAALATGAAADEFKEEPAARALYDRMLKALGEAQSLYYDSAYRVEADGKESGRCTFSVWIRKPNLFRLEARKANGAKAGTIVGDGRNLWLTWAGERPFFQSNEEKADWERSKLAVYLQEPAAPGHHSVAHKTSLLGAGMSMAVFNPSLFHGCPSSLDPYLDGVRGCGTEKRDGEICDGIEISYMSHQRSVHVWLSRKDGLPRRLRQVVRVSSDIVSEEVWTNVRRDGPLDDALFRWTPPDGWKRWRLPEPSERMVGPGEPAPEFRLRNREGGKTALSDFRGKLVWLCLWRVG